MSYEIHRLYFNGNPYKVVRKGLTLHQAQTHCRREDTHEPGVWFDGYEEMVDSRKSNNRKSNRREGTE